jgi:hypothetical protein
VVGAVPRDGEGGNRARARPADAMPIGISRDGELLVENREKLVDDDARVNGTPILPVAGFVLADVMLVALSIWDRQSNRRLIFPVALAVLLVYHWSVLTFHEQPLWHAVGKWFVGL